MLGVIVGDTLPAFVVAAVLGLIILIGQARARRWHVEKISTRPAALTALGLLVFYGTASANGPLGPTQRNIYLVTLAAGFVIGAGRSWTLYMWTHPLGLFVEGSFGTMVLWIVSLVGAGVVYGAFHVGFGGLVLFEGVSLLSQQLATIYRGMRARPRLAADGVRSQAAGVTPSSPPTGTFAECRPAPAIQGK